MMRSALWIFALVLSPLAGCGLRRELPAPAAPGPPPLGSVDKTFIDRQTMAGLAEVQNAQLALERTTSEVVRQFAHQMVSDHTAANQQLTALAQRKGVAPPAQPEPQQTAEFGRLQELRGASFDSAYLSDEIADYEQALALFQQEAQQGSDPDVKAFAEQTLPIVQQHLAMAEALEGGSGGNGARRRRRTS